MEANGILKQIALDVFGTDDGFRPKFPKTGEKIQEAMEISFKAGETFGRKDERLLLRAKLRGIDEIYDWSEKGLRDFRDSIEAKLKEWEG